MVEFNAKLPRPDEALDNAASARWWQENPMLYDWDREFGEPRLTSEYFEKIDRPFGEGHRLCNNPRWPQGLILENFIPYAELRDKRVLEIGCGAGLVASHLAKSGAQLTAIDLTPQAVQRTKMRFELAGLQGDIRQMDAEKLALADRSFDCVVSWGVIHHSGNMKAAVGEIHRVLKPGGKAYVMVYNRDSLRYRVYCPLWLGIVRAQLLRRNLATIAGSITDGFFARYLTEREFRDLSAAFSDVRFSYSDEVNTATGYLLGPLHRLVKPGSRARERLDRWLARRWGWYMQAVLTR